MPYQRAERFESPESRNARPEPLAWAAIFIAFTALAVLYALQARAQSTLEGRTEAWFGIIRRQLVLWWVRAALAPFALFWARRQRNAPFVAAALAHIAGSLVFGASAAVITGALDYGLRWTPPSLGLEDVLFANVLLSIATGVLAYLLIVAAYVSLEQARDRRRRELETSELRRELSESQLQFLRMQLHPHFLFNALNAVSGLMSQDVHRARVVLSRVGDLLRKSIDEGSAQEIPLRAELELLASYIEIQRIRFGERLAISFDVADPALDALVPSFVLQPILENAIKYGIERSAGNGRIAVRGRCAAGSLQLEVLDDGAGLSTAGDATVGLGIGLENTRVRLRRLYEGSASFDILSNEWGGTTVRIAIPAKLAA